MIHSWVPGLIFRPALPWVDRAEVPVAVNHQILFSHYSIKSVKGVPKGFKKHQESNVDPYHSFCLPNSKIRNENLSHAYFCRNRLVIQCRNAKK